MTSLSLRLARQWIAGESAEDAIERAKKSNSQGMLGLINLLGEHIHDRNQVEKTVGEYTHLLDLIEQSKTQSQISIKPTQLGMSLDPNYCLQNYLKIAEQCRSHSENWLWVDMEGSALTQKTIDLYEQIIPKYPECGIAIQAYLRRSESDLEHLLPLGARVRLVKGAYNEPAEIAFKSKKDVSKSYSRLMEMLFAQNNFFAIATHDGALVKLTEKLAKGSSGFEFEMLLGVRDKLKLELVRAGYQVREYIPYGPQWFDYSMRRLREKKSNIFLLARSLLSS